MSDASPAPYCLPALVGYKRGCYEKHHRHPEVWKPIFERFVHPELAEPMDVIAKASKVKLKTLYRW